MLSNESDFVSSLGWHLHNSSGTALSPSFAELIAMVQIIDLRPSNTSFCANHLSIGHCVCPITSHGAIVFALVSDNDLTNLQKNAV
jgi:hypothetical protein